METKIYVGNLSYDTTEDELRELFAQAGTVNAVDLIKDRDSGSSKGFAFVTMNSQEEANAAIEQLNGHSLGNRELKVSIARPREERSGGGVAIAAAGAVVAAAIAAAAVVAVAAATGAVVVAAEATGATRPRPQPLYLRNKFSKPCQSLSDRDRL